MDPLFERLGRLIRSMMVSEDSFQTSDPYSDNYDQDPDFRDAMDELDDFLKSGRESAEAQRKRKDSHRPGESHSYYNPGEDPQLKTAYIALKLPYGAKWEEIKVAHKTLLVKNHPDKFASDPAAFEKATEYTQILNEAFQRLKKHFAA